MLLKMCFNFFILFSLLICIKCEITEQQAALVLTDNNKSNTKFDDTIPEQNTELNIFESEIEEEINVTEVLMILKVLLPLPHFKLLELFTYADKTSKQNYHKDTEHLF